MVFQVTRVLTTVVAVTLVATACGSDSFPAAEGSTPTVGGSASNSVAIDSATSTVATPAATPAAAPTTVAATVAPPTTVEFPPAPRVLLIGDSTLQAVERYEKLPLLLGMDAVYEARSCRLLAVPSCGKDPPPNAVAVIDSAEGTFDMVVIMAGYDEWYDTFASSFDQVVASARAKGAKRVLWLSYPEGVAYRLPDERPGNESLVNINQIMRDKLASGAFPDVVIADWFHFASAAAPGWWNGDGIHLSPAGAIAVADYISRKVAFTALLPCPMPREPGGAVEVPCSDPDVVGPVADVVALYAA